MDHPRQADLPSLVDALVDAGIDFIVVGGAAAVIHGAPSMTQDLDIVPSLDDSNATRLLRLLDTLDAYVREPGSRRLRPQRDHLTAAGQIHLSTVLGPLDLLGRLHDGRGFTELEPHSEVMGDGERTIRVLDLPTLIEVKSAAGRARDKLVLPWLLALLSERESTK